MKGDTASETARHHISLDPIESRALTRLAEEEDRGIVSWTVQKLIDERMREKIGSDWRERLAAEDAQPQEAASTQP